MKTDKKRISTNFNMQVGIIRSAILNLRGTGRGFDGDDYPFKKAVRELRKEGINIVYDRERCSYYAN